jgi:23S rRNA (pseudouridine1915-N3)-methyltransferase
LIRIIAIGKNKDHSLQALEEEYLKRLSAFCKVEVVQVKDEADVHAERPGQARAIKEKEGVRVLGKLKADDFVILLDLHGQMWSSEQFAEKMQKWQTSHASLVFVIAGSLGPSEALVQRADVRWKLSDLTFTHLMTRVLVLEQIYRSFMINAGRNYHK